MIIPASLRVMPDQERKILSSLRGHKGCRIKVKKCAGSDRMLLTPAHVKKYQKAKQGSVVSLPFQHKHLVFGPILGGVAGGLIGRGINLKKKKKKKTGHGMYLNPYHRKKVVT